MNFFYNRAGLINAVFDEHDWAPKLSAEMQNRIGRFLDRALMRYALDAPFLFHEKEIRWAVHKDQVPGLVTDTLTTTTDAWVLKTVLAQTTANILLGALEWESDRLWDGRYILLKVPDPTASSPEEWHQIRIREVFSVNDPVTGAPHVHVSLDTPWHNVTDTDIEYRIISNEFTLPANLIELRSMALMEQATRYPYPMTIIGQTQAEFATFPHNNALQTSGPPSTIYRREYQQMLAPPTDKPLLSLTNEQAFPWLGPEPLGEFEYLVTYSWGKQEVWTDGSPATQTVLSGAQGRYEPYWESASSPVSESITVTGTPAPSIVIQLPNVDFLLGFAGAGTLRQKQSGIKKRIYRRRKTSEDVNHPSPGGFYFLIEIEGQVDSYTDNGVFTPDYKRPFREVHGYQTFRMHPRPDQRYELVMRAIITPDPLINDSDVPPLQKVGSEALILLTSYLLHKNEGNSGEAARAKVDYEEVLVALRKSFGDLRPPERLRRRRSARLKNRAHYRRDLAGISKTS